MGRRLVLTRKRGAKYYARCLLTTPFQGPIASAITRAAKYSSLHVHTITQRNLTVRDPTPGTYYCCFAYTWAPPTQIGAGVVLCSPASTLPRETVNGSGEMTRQPVLFEQQPLAARARAQILVLRNPRQ
jgi:hypothetical protein